MRPRFSAGFRTWCVVLALWCGALAHAAEQHPLIGVNREEVLSRYGQPRNTLVAGNRELYFYATERVVLRDGIVVEVDRLPVEASKKAPPPPAESPAPTSTSAPATVTEPPAPQKAEPAQPVPAPTPAPVAESTTPTPSPEPKLEIKRVLPRGAPPSQPRPATKDEAITPVPAPPSAASKAVSPKASTATTAPRQSPASPTSSTSSPSSTPSTSAPATPGAGTGAAPAASERAGPPTSPSATPTEQTAAAGQTTPSETPATTPAAEITTPTTETTAAQSREEAAATKKKLTKRAIELAAARRRLEEAQSDAIDPTAAAFTTKNYLIALLIVGGGIGFLVWRHRQRQLALEATSVSRTPFETPSATSSGTVFTTELLAKLEWKRFEELAAAYYSKTGVVAVRTKSGPTAPVHINISWKGEPRPFALVQCIAHPQGLIDAKPLQELFTVLTAEDIRRGYVVTTGKFNVPARDFAEEKHITLLPGDIFIEKLNALPDAARAELMQQVTTGDYTTPSCPKCEAKMVRSPEDPSLWRCAVHPDQQIAARK